MITLREYQQRIIAETRLALREHDSVLIQSATGSGKTVIATDIIGKVIQNGKRAFFNCHRQELVDQTAKTFTKAGIPFGYIAAGLPPNPYQPVQICSIDTLKNRIEKIPHPDLCMWDEAHHIGAAGWARCKDTIGKAKHIGLSATPTRLDGKGLIDHFSHMVLGPSVASLIKEGSLSDFDFFAPGTPDMSEAHQRMGDFVRADAEFIMDKNTIIGDMVRHWLNKAAGKKTIIFAVSVSHSEHIVKTFQAANIRAIHLDAKTPKEIRREIARQFARGDIDVISNVGLFGEGYDLSAQADSYVTVDCVIDAQPTMSLSWVLQKWGRALRPKSDGSKAVILDHAGNWTRHGFPDDDREWSLDSKKRIGKSATEKTNVNIKQCPECFMVHRPEPACPYCGHLYQVSGRKISEVDDELFKLDRERLRKEKRKTELKEQGQCRDLGSLVELAARRGYKNPEKWASKVWTARKVKEQQRYGR